MQHKRLLSLLTLGIVVIACSVSIPGKSAAQLTPTFVVLPTVLVPSLLPSTEEPVVDSVTSQPTVTQEPTSLPEPSRVLQPTATSDSSAPADLNLQLEVAVDSLAFSPDGALLATGSYGYGSTIWDMSTGSNVREFLEDPISEGGFVEHKTFFSPDGAELVTVSDSQNVIEWDVASGERLHVFAFEDDLRDFFGKPTTAVALSPDGALLAYGTHEGEILVWDFATGQDLASMDETHFISRPVAIAWSPDSKQLSSVSDDGNLIVQDYPRGQSRTLVLQPSTRWDIVWVAEGIRIASVYHDLEIYDPDTGAVVHRIPEPQDGGLSSLAFSQDGTLIAAGGENGVVSVWDVATGDNVAALDAHGGRVSALAFSRDNSVLAAGWEDGTTSIWPLSTTE